MAENKQLGTLQLSSGNVLSTINKVNNALKNIGKGVDLDLTKILDAKVSQTLSGLQKQIEAIGKSSSGAAKQTANQVKEASDLQKKQISLQSELTKATGSAAKDELTRQINARTGALSRYTPATQEQARATKTVTEAQEKYNLAVAKSVDKQAAAEAKRLAQEQAAAQKQAAKAASDNAKEAARANREAMKEQEKLIRQQEQYASRIGNIVVSKVGTFSLSLQREQWSAAIEYASTYYDTLNEIRVVTGKSEEEATRMGNSFRQLAKEMRVTSTELSKAAVTFYRQGLSDSQVNQRLNWVTKYAKVANIDFDRAAELITASSNAMSEDIQNDIERVVDVFLYLGDAAATSGEEIGVAMQKASASATEFGLSFEWLGTYIATVSEQTRQAPESIGNAFNSMMARLHSIKQMGYNEEDETKINDVAKALKTVGVTLMDSEGNWRDMSTIFTEISEKWETMNGKQKSYIATTLAGTRQQNVFFALMNDMSKGIEGGSRAWELYTGAMEAAGTATQKFTVWQESVQASQNNMKTALEQLYSSFQPNLIKGFYDSIAWLVDGINTLGPASLVISAATVSILAFAHGIETTGGILAATRVAFASHPIFATASIIVGIIALTGVIGGLLANINTSAKEYEEATNKLEEANNRIGDLEKTRSTLNTLFDKMQSGVELTTTEITEYNSAIETIASISPTAQKAVDDLKNGFIDQATAAGILNGELETLIGYEKNAAQLNAIKALSNWSPPESWAKQNSFGQNNIGSDDVLTYLKDFGYDNTTEGFAVSIQKAQESLWSKPMTQLEDSLFDSFGNITSAGKFYNIIGKSMEGLNLRNNSPVELSYGFDQWPLLASYAYRLLVGDDQQIEDFQSELEQSAQALIDLAIKASSNQYGELYNDLLAEYYRSIIVGEDGILSEEDFDKINDSLLEAVNTWLSKGTNLFSNSDILRNIFDSLFGEGASSEMDYVLSQIAEDDETVTSIKDAYEALLKAGIDKVDIASLFSSAGYDEWGNIISYALSQFEIPTDFWERLNWGEGKDIDEEAKALIYRFMELGGSIEQVEQCFEGSYSLVDFKTKLAELSVTTQAANKDLDETPKTVKEFIESIGTSYSTIDKINSIIKEIKEDKTYSISDILGLAKTHPELLAVMSDLEQLEEKLEAIKNDETKNVRENLSFMLYNDEQTFLENQKYRAGNYWEARQGWLNERGIKSFQEELDYYKDQYGEDSVQYKTEVAIIEGLINRIMKAFEKTEELKGSISGVIDVVNDLENVDKAKDALKILTNPDGVGVDKISNALQTLQNIFPELESSKADTIIQDATTATNNLEQSALSAAKQFGVLGQAVVDSMQEGEESLAEFAAKIAETLYHNQSSSGNYQEQVSSLSKAIEQGGIEKALEVWNGFDSIIKNAIGSKFPQLIIALNNADKSAKQFGNTSKEAKNSLTALEKTLTGITNNNAAKYFTNTVKAIEGLNNGTERVSDGVAAMNKEIETAIKAQTEYEAAAKKMAKGEEIAASEVSNLASMLGGIDAQWILDNWAEVGPMMADALAEGQDAIARFNEAAFISITGNANVDFSDLEKGLITTQGQAQDTIDRLLAIGQFDVETVQLDTEAWVFENGQWIKKMLHGATQVLKPKNTNPLSGRTSYTPKTTRSSSGNTGNRSSGGGSGGSGNSSSASQVSEVEKMLDIMEQIQKLYANTRNIFQAQQNYYQQTGELQGVIMYLQKEGEAILGQNKELEENIAEIEKWMAIKKQELSSLSLSSEEYEQAASDLKALQDRHQEYTKQLIDNKTQIDKLNKAIKEQNDAIRSMEIDLRNIILEAIKDREALNERMLQGTITTENTILDLIQKRYEKERDLILDNAQKQIDALKEERDLLSEQLQLRKEQQEQEDKAAKLADLQAKYARIVADPTRRNEALNIQQQIKDLQKEMAWDTAEKELKAKQDELDNQVSSLEDYVEYVKDWYDELFNHPQKLIEEMQSIIVQVDDDIITWLKENDEEFADATEATQKNMVNSWQEMLMDMHGEIKTYWDEVEEIIAGGDEAIIKFLVENSADYKAAGKLQAQAYVSEWVDKLNKLALAHKQVSEAMIYNNYAVIASATGGTVSRSSGGSGGSSISTGGSVSSGSSGGSTTATQRTPAAKKTTGYTATFNNTVGRGTTKEGAWSNLQNQLGYTLQEYTNQHPEAISYARYKKGGIITSTGPAYLDGTEQDPERILSAKQNSLFESLVNSMERMSKVSVPSLPMIGNDWVSGRGSAVSVGDIILNVDRLENDDDYEEVADRVLDMIMEKVNRGSAIGGIRF